MNNQLKLPEDNRQSTNNYNSNRSQSERLWGITDVIERLNKVKKTSANNWIAACPAHEDKHPSLSISVGRNDQVLLNCHAGCTFEDIVSSLDLPKSEIVATYDYVDENGELLYQAVRKVPKTFLQRRPDGKGNWIWSMKDVRRILYRLPELLETEPNINVFIVEGEKDADNLRREFGLVVTTNVGGAGKWREDYNEYLQGRSVIILPDNDKPGREHAEQVARSLDGIAKTVKISNLPNLPEKGDVSDWINSGGTVEDLHKIIEETPVFVPDNLLAEEVKTAVSNPNIKTAAELLATEFPEPKFAINGLLSEGATVFAGAPKLGKSWCALGFAVAIASGGKALGTISVERGDVLLPMLPMLPMFLTAIFHFKI